MTATGQILNFEQYRIYEDGTDTRYELERGELIPMGQARGQHAEIMRFLEQKIDSELDKLGLDWVVRQAAIGVRIPQVGKRDTSRCPDICVIPKEQWRGLLNREAIIELDEPAPLLVIEVVSTGTEIRDHRTKRTEYGMIGIRCYVLVDWTDFDQNKKPIDKRVTVLSLVDGFYDEAVYRGSEVVEIPTLKSLKLTASQIINAEL